MPPPRPQVAPGVLGAGRRALLALLQVRKVGAVAQSKGGELERVCDIIGCANAAVKAGLCWGHYKRRQRGQELDTPLASREPRPTPVERLFEAALQYAEAADDDEYRRARYALRRNALEYALDGQGLPRQRRRPAPGVLCSVPGCAHERRTGDLCWGHAKRKQRALASPIRPRK